MYFAMEYPGLENIDRLKEIHDQSEKWHFIYNLTSEFGFTGIQFFPAYEKEFGLSFQNIPKFISKSFRLTYHAGDTGISQLITPDEIEKADVMFSTSLRTASLAGTEDVSFHPPLIADIALLPVSPEQVSPVNTSQTKENLRKLINKWIPQFNTHNITLSMETHMTPHVFIFSGLTDFHEFVSSIPGLGILVDVSHNHFDGNEIDNVIQTLKPLGITGFHLSDAIRGKKLADGTHLPVGEGQIDFGSIVASFRNKDTVYGALEVRGAARWITDSLAFLKTLA